MRIDCCKVALFSVTEKSGIEELAVYLVNEGFQILSTGGTYNYLSNFIEKDKLIEVSDYTGSPEILGGRVKTLHPYIHGGILAKGNSDEHQLELNNMNIANIDVVVVNLYKFSEGVKKDNITDEEAVELIDIGGHTLLRSAAKNYDKTLVVVEQEDYFKVVKDWDMIDENYRRKMALKAFKHVLEYDKAIVNYFDSKNHNDNNEPFDKLFDLKYGCNPHQKEAAVWKVPSKGCGGVPLRIVNGNAGYINILDALGAWNLVREVKEELNIPAAASFKHTSPAGVGLGVPLNEALRRVYSVEGRDLSLLATAFARARNADPLSSFGDFIALSDVVDVSTAKLISREVSDGVIAPGYEEEALNILMKKRGGKYLILEANMDWDWNQDRNQFRELNGGVVVSQTGDQKRVGLDLVKVDNVVVDRDSIFNEEIQRDLVLANITLKYTQSNSVVYACNGQVIGVGAGQQNRVDCVKLAGWKSETWVLRQMPKVIELLENGFKEGIKRQDKVNAIYDYLETSRKFAQLMEWEFDQGGGGNFNEPVQFLGLDQRREFCSKFFKENKIVMASDAFFPFPDSIIAANKYGVRFVTHPGGSLADEKVIAECHRKGMGLIHTGVRIFTH